MVHVPAAMDRPSIMQGLLQCVEHEAGVCRAQHPPAHDPAGIGVDHKSDIDFVFFKRQLDCRRSADDGRGRTIPMILAGVHFQTVSRGLKNGFVGQPRFNPAAV
jgi:hypothetical protein